MVQLIAGKKGKGKTKILLDKVNEEVKKVQGSIVYLDKSTKHMYELNNRIRMINVTDYSIGSCDEFLGFISGIISQDHDIQKMYFDSFLKIACLEEGADIAPVIAKLEKISQSFNIDFVLSVSLDEHEFPEDIKSKIIVSL